MYNYLKLVLASVFIMFNISKYLKYESSDTCNNFLTKRLFMNINNINAHLNSSY